MYSDSNSESMSRREFLSRAVVGAASLALLGESPARVQQAPASPYAPFKMGIQSYSLRHFSLDDALAKTQQLGLTYWEAYPEHLPITDDPSKISEYKDKLSAHNIKLR